MRFRALYTHLDGLGSIGIEFTVHPLDDREAFDLAYVYGSRTCPDGFIFAKVEAL